MEGILPRKRLADRNLRHCGEQVFCILLRGLVQKPFRVSEFDEFTGSHHGYPRGDLCYHRQTVRNKRVVRPNSPCSSCSSSNTCAPTDTSSAETGSSAITSFGRRIK